MVFRIKYSHLAPTHKLRTGTRNKYRTNSEKLSGLKFLEKQKTLKSKIIFNILMLVLIVGGENICTHSCTETLPPAMIVEYDSPIRQHYHLLGLRSPLGN